MSEAQHDLGQVNVFKAEAIGSPGKRTFRLLVDASKGGACLWIEKEQLYNLSVSIERMLNATPSDRGSILAESDFESDEDYQALEIKIGRLGVGYEQESDQFVFLVHDVDSIKEILEEAAEASEERPDDESTGENLGADALVEEALSSIEPTVSFQANRSVLSEMCQQAQEVCMGGGRPLCPLCNQLVDPQGHVCPRTNGHHPKPAQELG